MDKDNKIILGALLIMFVSMLSFNLNSITGKQVNEGLPDLTADAYFVDLETGEKLESVYIGKKADIIIKIKNDGFGNAPPGDKLDKTKYRFEIKVDGKKTDDRALKKTFSLNNNIKPQDYAIKKLAQITTVAAYNFNSVGKHCIDIKVDTSKKLAEIEEDNDFLNLGCVTVVEEGKELPKKEEEKKVTTTTKKKKTKEAAPTSVNLKLLEYYTNSDGEYTEILLDKKECELKGSFGVSCSFKAELEGPSAGANEGQSWKNYIVRGSTTTNFWKVRHVRLVDSYNKEFLRKACSTYLCELKTGDMLKTDTKFNQYIKPGTYIIETIAELSTK